MKIKNVPDDERKYDSTSTQPYYTLDNHNHNHYHYLSSEKNVDCDKFTLAFPSIKERCSAKSIFIQYPELPHKNGDPTQIVDPLAELNQQCYRVLIFLKKKTIITKYVKF